MAAESSSHVYIPSPYEPELRELERSPVPRSPVRATPVITPPRTRSPTMMNQSMFAVDKTLSSAANLVKLLPSATVLIFQALAPSFTHSGTCSTSNIYLTGFLIYICVLSCVFFSFTDSFVGRDGKLYYGLATFKGFYVFNYDGPDEDRAKVFRDLSRLRVRFVDYVHAFFSVMVLLTLVFSDSDIQNCFFSHAGRDARELLVNLPLGAGLLSSLVFLIFPTTRKGIGYTDATPHPH